MITPIVLAYHLVDCRFDFGITRVTPKQFERQISWLAENNYHSRSLSYFIENKDRISEKDVIITFDDGYDSLIDYALPILSKHDYQATVFPVVEYIGKKNEWDVNLFWRKFSHLDWGGLRELAAAGWEIGSHSLSHQYLPQLSSKVLLDDLKRSRDVLEDGLSIFIHHLSLPFGRYSRRVLDSAIKAGYKTVVTLGQHADVFSYELAENNSNDEHFGLYMIPRRGVYYHDTVNSFKRRVICKSNSKREFWRQRFISFFSNGTIILKSLSSPGTTPKEKP